MIDNFQFDREYAIYLDNIDPLKSFREKFYIPQNTTTGNPKIYFCGHSLGLQPKTVRSFLEEELDAWANTAVAGHFKSKNPWVSYDDGLKELMANVVGAKPQEVALMNGLTVNLHLMMVSFYNPTTSRHKILIQPNEFPSDQYAVQSQIKFHGFDPKDSLLEIKPSTDKGIVKTEDILEYLEIHGKEISLLMFSAVNYLTGQVFDVKTITAAAHRQGCKVGIDLAHAAGNILLNLHGWDVDFAVWCTYKYLNSGPGGVAGCFVHEQHCNNPKLPRFAGWWGTDPKIRFDMGSEFKLQSGANGWQLSNLPILPMASLRASLEIFQEAGMQLLRNKSELLTRYLFLLLNHVDKNTWVSITPEDSQKRGCEISFRILKNAENLLEELEKKGIVCDLRRPNIIRIAPVPLYNKFEEVWIFANELQKLEGII